MTINGLVQIVLFFGILLALVKPLGWYMAQVHEGKPCGLDRVLGPTERSLYRLCGIRSHEEMTWKTYAVAMLLFGVTMVVIPYRAEPRGFANGEFYVKCLPMETAVDLARSTLGPNSEIRMPNGSRVLRFSGSVDDMKRLQQAIESAEKTATSCTNAPPGR